MSFIGMLALGIFVGSIISIGVLKTTDWSKLQGLFVTILGSALSGAVFAFINYLGGTKLGDAVFLYPLGLLLALMWAYARAAAQHIQAPDKSLRLLGWLHLVGLLIVTGATTSLLFSPSLRELLPK